jgi:4-amino-4-deoxy-L-arabinose transferase-like glycosyltransferase
MDLNKNEYTIELPKFFEDKFNLALIGLILFAVILRIIYININQAVWWDEAVYLLQAKHYLFNSINTGWWAGKGIALPVMLYALFKITGGVNLIAARFMEILFSTGTLFLTYLIAKKFFGREIAFFSVAFLSVIWMDIFYSVKILSDIPSVFFTILAFWLLMKDDVIKKYPIILSGILLIFAGMLRSNAWLMFFPFLMYIIWLDKKKLKWFLIGILIAALIYMSINSILYGNPIYEPLQFFTANVGGGNFDFLYYFASLIPIFTVPVVILFIISLIYNWKKKKSLFMIIAVFLLIFILSLAKVSDYRYIYYIFPFFCIIASLGMSNLTYKIKLSKYFFIIGILIFAVVAFLQISFANDQLVNRGYSYYEIKTASEWIKANSPTSVLIMSMSQPQVTFYSERATIQFPKTEQEFIGNITKEKPDYAIVSAYETHPDYVNKLINGTLVNVTILGGYNFYGTQQVSTILIKFNY